MAENPFADQVRSRVKRVPFGGPQRGKQIGRAKVGMTWIRLRLAFGLHAWYADRAAALDVPCSFLICDVLTQYRELVRMADAEAGFQTAVPPLDPAEEEMTIPERLPGYRAKLTAPLRGTVRSHLDPSPLGIEEM